MHPKVGSFEIIAKHEAKYTIFLYSCPFIYFCGPAFFYWLMALVCLYFKDFIDILHDRID